MIKCARVCVCARTCISQLYQKKPPQYRKSTVIGPYQSEMG